MKKKLQDEKLKFLCNKSEENIKEVPLLAVLARNISSNFFL